MRNSRKRIKRIRRRTLKMRGGDLDDPDTKDFMNSKIADLEQKIAELENNMPVQIGYKELEYSVGMIGSGHARGTKMPIVVNKNITTQNFWMYIGQGTEYQNNSSLVTIFLPVLYSLPNVRGLNMNYCKFSFMTDNKEENDALRDRKVDVLNAKYPGLFVK